MTPPFPMRIEDAKWASTLAHVREVSLLGAAELGYWKDRLGAEALVPVEQAGSARVMIIAADAKFMGVRFRELSVSVLARPEEWPTPEEGAYLTGAWNSSRFFAFCERAFFSTPYRHGDVRVRASAPVSIQVMKDGEVVFGAGMGADGSATGREPTGRGEGGWEGPVFLPRTAGAKGGHGKMFFARLQGHTETYPFLHGSDSLTIKPARGDDALRPLIDSRFRPEQWSVRTTATHAKSRTYERDLRRR